MSPSEGKADDALGELVAALAAGGYHFVTPTPATHGRVNARPGNERARSVADVFGWSRPFAPDVLRPVLFDLAQEAGILVADGGLWRSLVRVSSLAGELFVHSAYPTTAPDSVFFGPDTYRFAAAISAGLARRSGPIRRAVDIGCGAGPGGILVAKAAPDAAVAMVDINDRALRLARINAGAAGAANATAIRSDLLGAVPGEFDLIVSNPPYLLDPSERAYRHGGGQLGEGLSLAILRAALGRLAPGGTLILYTGVAIVDGRDLFGDHAAEVLADGRCAWDYREMDPDVFGEELETPTYRDADRIAAVVLSATRRD